ncbi:MAG: hypothetical protein JSW68_07415, partial [Burkholderiales bacterium]
MSTPGAGAARERRPAWWRLPLLAFGFVALFVGAAAGLARVGWSMPALAAGAAAMHGPLMICGFFGVVIALERAVAIGQGWAYAGPALAAAGTVAAIGGASAPAAWMYLACSLVLLVASLDVLRRQRELFVLTLVIAAACFAAGTARWAAGAPVYQAVGWWVAFLVLTIAGERLELSRFMPRSPSAETLFAVLVAAALAGLLAGSRPWGMPLFGAALL